MSFLRQTFRRLRYGDPVVVVSGLPRSGTSMTMKMLEAGGLPLVIDGIRTADEDNPKGYYEDERVKDLAKVLDKSWLKDARGRSIKIISYLLKELPRANQYKILFMRRHLDEVLASQAKMLDRRNEPNPTSDEEMRRIYQQHLDEVEALVAKHPTMEKLDVDYRELIEKPLEGARKIDAFLGGGHSIEDMAAMVDKNLYRNRAKS